MTVKAELVSEHVNRNRPAETQNYQRRSNKFLPESEVGIKEQQQYRSVQRVDRPFPIREPNQQQRLRGKADHTKCIELDSPEILPGRAGHRKINHSVGPPVETGLVS